MTLNFDIGNNFIKSFYYVLVYIDENQNVAKNKLAFYPSLLVKKDSSTYEGYLNVIQADYTRTDEKLFFKVVKTAFNQRRKMLRSSLKSFNISDSLKEDPIFAKRPEQLSVQEFIFLTQKLANHDI